MIAWLRNGKKSRRRLAIIKLMLMAMLFVAVLPPPQPAVAACTCTTAPDTDSKIMADQIATVDAIGIVWGFLQTIYQFLSGAFTFLMQSGFSSLNAAITGSAAISSQVTVQAANFGAQAAAQQALLTEGARMQAEATMSSQDLTCSVANLSESTRQLGQRQDLGAALAYWVIKSCQGPNSDCSGPNQVRHYFNDLCQLGFLSTDNFGSLVQNCPQPQSVNYENLTSRISSLLTQPQLEMPSGCVMPDGFIGFAPNSDTANCQQGSRADAATSPNATPATDKNMGAALFLACEMLYDAPKSILREYRPGQFRSAR